MSILSDSVFAIFMWGTGIAAGFMLGYSLTDSPQRAEAQVVYDSGTGCQYLSYGSSSLIPRRDAKGQPICQSMSGAL